MRQAGPKLFVCSQVLVPGEDKGKKRRKSEKLGIGRK